MNRYKGFAVIVVLMLLMISIIAANAEGSPEGTEQGLEEIIPLMDMTDVNQTEGMSLEEMTDAVTESTMSEYADSATGFCMQYPSIFLFDEDQEGTFASTADGKATLTIDNMVNENSLDEEALREAIRLETTDADIRKNEQNGCLRTDRVTNNGKTGQTDLYLLTQHSFHHILITYPIEEQGTYFTYIEYMINSMETKETDLG